jgi:hypothetical protein
LRRNFGGRELKKDITVSAMYSAMLKSTTKMMLWAERVWRAPVAKQDENVVLG